MSHSRPEKSEMRLARDRFLAFAFASSDVFLEISMEGKVTFITGASKGLTGFEEKDILGKNWLNLFSVYDQAQVQNIYENAQAGKRCGPLLVDLNELVSKRRAVFSAIRMPEDSYFYVTLGFSNILMSKIAGDISKATGGPILTRTAFIEQAQETMDIARSLNQELDLTLFDFAPTQEDKDRFGNDNWGKFTEALSGFLQSQAVDGNAAGMITDGRYSVIHEESVDGEYIRERIEAMALENDPEGKGIEVSSKTIKSEISNLSERDAARALVYTINEFEREGTELSIESLNSGFKDYMDANAQKIKEFQNMIDRLDFSLHFQPIVDIKTGDVSHFEMLSRFDRGDTLEWVMFGEDVGLASAFDLAVVERALNHLKHKGGGSRTRFSINISGQSIEDKEFFEKLQEKLQSMPNASERLMFEITESSHIKDLGKANRFVKKLQEDGFTVALDDFGAGAASFQYLQKLNVDMVKIDGKYIRKLLTSRRDAAMVKNLTQMCQDLDIAVIAEFVEEQAQADILIEMGVQFGQGYLYGKAESAPSFTPPKK